MKRFAMVAVIGLAATTATAQDPNFRTNAAAMYAVQPDIANCKTGALSEAEKKRVLDVVNAIRFFHGLPPVVYDYASDPEVMEASLIIAASGQLSHNPQPGARCWSQTGQAGAKSSNLSGGLISPYLSFENSPTTVVGWLTDVQNAVADNVGHRRWLLDPFLEKIAFGRVAGAVNGGMTDGAAIKVIYSSSRPTAATVDYVAYPSGNYPDVLYDNRALLSFSVLFDKANKFANQRVDYSAARVTVKTGGASQPISDLRYDTQGFGLPNNLQFKAGTLQGGVRYDVTIENVKVNGEVKTYSYWFKLTPLD